MYMKRIIVVGSGIVGASAAYQLVKKNVEVILIDKKQDGKATSDGAGIISPWTSRVENEDWYKIVRGGAIFYTDLIEKLKQNGEEEDGYKKVGELSVSYNQEELDLIEIDLLEKQKNTTVTWNIK